MAKGSMGVWNTLEEKIPGLWRFRALGRKLSSVYRTRLRFTWPIYVPWWYFLNREPRRLYRRRRLDMTTNPVEQRVVDEIKEKGISIIHFRDLFPAEQFTELQELAEMWLQKPVNQARIIEIEGKHFEITAQKRFALTDKFYLLRLLGDQPVFDGKDKFLEISLNEKVLRIVCGYFRMFSRLVNVNIWYNVATDGPDAFSQRWHRDPDDRKEVKLFLYLRDVNKDNGPFCYIPRTHNGGRFRRSFAQTILFSKYPPDGAVEKKFSGSQTQVCTGKAGTLILCDTTGLHKGGHAVTEGRLLFTATYTTNAGTPVILKERHYSVSELPAHFVSSAAEYAISHLKD